MSVDYLSVSKISTVLMCGWSAKYKYVDHIPELSSGTFQAGKTVHAVIERALLEKSRTEKLMTEKDADDLYTEQWGREKMDEEGKGWFLGWNWNDKGHGTEAAVKELYRPLTGLFVDRVLPKIAPRTDENGAYVEREFNVMLESDIGPFRLKGVIDCLEGDTDDTLDDWKTADGKVSDFSKGLDVQFMGYGVWHHALTGRAVMNARKVFLVARKRRECTIEVKSYKIGVGYREMFKKIAADVWKSFQTNTFLPTGRGTWKCSEKWCSFHPGCQGEVG